MKVGVNIRKRISQFLRTKYTFSNINSLPTLSIPPSVETNYESLKQMASDQLLLRYIKDENYLFQDLVPYSTALALTIEESKVQPSDTELIFLAFIFNLYQDRFQSPIIYKLCIDHLKHKNSKGIYSFQSQGIEKQYLEQFYYLTHKDVPTIQERIDLIQNYYSFLTQKFKIQKLLTLPLEDETLTQLSYFFLYIPNRQFFKDMRKELKAFKWLPELIKKLIVYQTQRMVKLRKRQKILQECYEESMGRFRKLREICFKCFINSPQHFDLFSCLPFQFEQEDDFIIFITVLKQFLIEGLSKTLFKNDINIYHKRLIPEIKAFRSAKAYRAIEAYCQTLVFLNLYKPESFVEYFDPKGPIQVPIEGKLLRRYQESDLC